MDNFFNSKKFVIFCVVLLLCVALVGCAKPKPKIDENKLGAIGNMIGCMFNPSLCETREIPKDDLRNPPIDEEEEWNKVTEETN